MGKPKKDSMVDSGYGNGFVNELPGDDSFHDVINLFDSMESLEGDDSVDAEDWEAQFEILGPIPSEILKGFTHLSLSNYCNDMQGFWPSNFVPSDGTSELKQLPDVGEVSSDSCHAKKSSLYHTPSPISVLESSGSYLAEKSMATSPELLIPVRTRSKRQRPSSFCKWHLFSPITPSEKTLNKKGQEKKRKKLSQLPEDSEVKENHQHMNSKRCTHCQVTKTPQWREGPMGPRTLCNACGVRYRSGRLLPEYRPLASPTFVPSLHSNSHRKVIQMRKKFIKESSMPEMNPVMLPPPEIFPMKVMQMRNEVVQESLVPEMDPAMSPPPEFVPMSSYLFDRI